MATNSTSENALPASERVDLPTLLPTLLPMLHLFRASGLAIDPRKMFLGGMALILLAAGDWLFGFLPFASKTVTIHNIIRQDSPVHSRLPGCLGFGLPQIETWMSWEAVAFALFTPIRTLVAPAQVVFQSDPSWSDLAFAWTQLLWALIVWSLIGGALCRMNALQFAVRKRISPWTALRFSRRQLQGYLVAPLLPFSAVLILQGFNYLLGLLASLIPDLGGIVLGIGWCLVLFSGFLMAMLVAGVLGGWPLMIAAISTEDSDGFDGLSRTFGYLFDRPWHAALAGFLSLPVFAVSRFVVALLIGLTVSLGAGAVERGYDADSPSPGVRAQLTARPDISTENPAGGFVDAIDRRLTGRGHFSLPGRSSDLLIVAWASIAALLYAGFGPSFFWSAATVTYFLLRRSDDGTPLDTVVDWSERADSKMSADAESAHAAPEPEGSR